MYCPSCGAENTHALRYCKRCGANFTDTAHLAVPVSDSPSPRYTGAAWGIGLASVAITLGGLGIIFSHAWDLVGPFHPGPVSDDATMVAMTMIIFGTATIFGIIALLIRLFTRLLSAPSEPARPAKTIKPVAGAYTPAQIPAPHVPSASVTEHTTRTFQHPAYEEMKSRE